MQYQRETLYAVIDEVESLIELHYQEVTLHKEHMKLAVDWPRYRALEEQGRFLLYTARAEGRLVGYCGFFTDLHIHYLGNKIAVNDALFLHPDFRKGSCGARLIAFADQNISQLGPIKITWHIKFSHDFRPILHRLGYIDEEVIVGRIATGDH